MCTHTQIIEVLGSWSFSPNLQALWVLPCPTPKCVYLVSESASQDCPCPLHQVTLFRSQDIFAALTPQRESGSHFHVPFHLPLTNHLRNFLLPQKLCLPFSPKTVPQRPHLTVAGTAPEQPHSLYKGAVLNLDCHN